MQVHQEFQAEFLIHAVLSRKRVHALIWVFRKRVEKDAKFPDRIGGGLRIVLSSPERITLRRTDLSGVLTSRKSLELSAGEHAIPLRKHRGPTVVRIQGRTLSRGLLMPGL